MNRQDLRWGLNYYVMQVVLFIMEHRNLIFGVLLFAMSYQLTSLFNATILGLWMVLMMITVVMLIGYLGLDMIIRWFFGLFK